MIKIVFEKIPPALKNGMEMGQDSFWYKLAVVVCRFYDGSPKSSLSHVYTLHNTFSLNMSNIYEYNRT